MEVFSLLLLYLTVNFSSVIAEKCITPNSTEGNCIPLQQCPKIQKVIEEQMIEPDLETLTYLIYSQCGFNATDVNVCCPRSTCQNSTVTTEIHNQLELNDTSSLEEYLRNNLHDDDKCGLQKNTGRLKRLLTTIYDHPWLALVGYRNKDEENFGCGGVLVSDRYVLTAAHCVESSLTQPVELPTFVRLGEHNVERDLDCYMQAKKYCAPPPLNIPVEKTISHPDFNPDNPSRTNDIALLRLSQQINFNEFVRPICLPSEDSSYDNLNNKLYIAGWGQSKNRTLNPIKLQNSAPTISPEDCLVKYNDQKIVLDKSQICIGKDNQAVCKTDSGGPLMSFNNNEDKWFVSGILSSKWCNTEAPVVYTKITPYLDWIRETMLL